MDPVTIARHGVSDFDEPHRTPDTAAAPDPAWLLQLDQAAHAAALTEIGRVVVEIRLLQRLHDAYANAARRADPTTWHTNVERRDRVAATLLGRRTVLAELVATVAERIAPRPNVTPGGVR